MFWDKKNQSFVVDDGDAGVDGGDGGGWWGRWEMVGMVWDDGETVTLEPEHKCWQLT